MVLTNFECWAHAGVAADSDIPASRHVDLFSPRAVPQALGQVPSAAAETQSTLTSAVSHISSNGYYGFASYVNAAHELNNNNNNNNDDTTCNNNNNNVVNIAAKRCKKRFFVSANDEDNLFGNIAAVNNNNNNNNVHGQVAAAAKRCRYDDDDFAAQYFNDFFSMQATTQQIGTQSCLMDTDELYPVAEQLTTLTSSHTQQQPVMQQQVDVAMAAPTSLHTNNDPSNAYHSLLQQQQPQQVLYQGHLHRTNRDVSRCMLSHMI